MIKKIIWKNLNWLWLSVGIISLDQSSKLLAVKYLSFEQPKVILPVFNLTLAYNTGAAFSFLNEGAGWQRWLFIGVALLVSLIMLIWLIQLKNKKWLAMAIGLIVGGALANLWDRLTIGYVIDFIQLHIQQWSWPIFNIADSAVFIGALILIIDAFRKNSA